MPPVAGWLTVNPCIAPAYPIRLPRSSPVSPVAADDPRGRARIRPPHVLRADREAVDSPEHRPPKRRTAVPRTSRFLISMTLALATAVIGSQTAVAAERAPAPGHPVTVTASVPAKAAVNRSFAIDVDVSGQIAGLQAQVMLDQKAAEVGGVVTVARG